MYCKSCNESRKVNPFTSCVECTNFRTYVLTRHVSSRDHKCAIQDVVISKEFSIATERVLSENEEIIMCALKAVYWLAKKEIPSSKFPSLLL